MTSNKAKATAQDRVIDKMKAVQAMGMTVETPHSVYCATNSRRIEIFGDQLCFGHDTDYVSLEHARESIAWFVHQLGGKVKWE